MSKYEFDVSIKPDFFVNFDHLLSGPLQCLLEVVTSYDQAHKNILYYFREQVSRVLISD